MTFTYGPGRMFVTPLGPDGEPTGEPVEIGGVRSFTLNTWPDPTAPWVWSDQPQPKEHTMPVLPDIPTGLTKSRMWERHQQLLADRDQLQADHDELAAQLADQDPEARTLGACINALDAMLTGERTAAETRRASAHYGVQYAELAHTTPHRPTALDSSVGRILLHLAARYDVDLVAMPPFPPEDEPPTLAEDGQKLMVVPEKLANSIQQLLEQLSHYDLDQLR